MSGRIVGEVLDNAPQNPTQQGEITVLTAEQIGRAVIEYAKADRRNELACQRAEADITAELKSLGRIVVTSERIVPFGDDWLCAYIDRDTGRCVLIEVRDSTLWCAADIDRGQLIHEDALGDLVDERARAEGNPHPSPPFEWMDLRLHLLGTDELED